MCYLVVLSATPAAEGPVDPALLEYLGSVDSEDKNWHDYLAHTDIDQVARRARRPSVAVPPPSPPPAPSDPASVPSRPPASATPPSVKQP
jgi:hypothetical protein